MTVLSAFGGQVKPGRFDEVVETHRTGAKIVERHGAKNPRILTVSLGVEAFGAVVFTMRFDSAELFGACYDELMADEEIIRLMSDMRGANTPYVAQQAIVANEIPLGSEANDARGSVLLAGTSRLVPGRMKEAVESTTAAHEYYLSHGAVNHRLWVYVVAGTQSNIFLSVAEFESMRGYGRLLDSFSSDPEARHMLKESRSTDAPTTFASVNIFTEIPL